MSNTSSSNPIPDKQKAWRAVKRGTPAEAIRFDKDAPVPSKLKQGEVLVKVQAAALNPVDYKLLGMLPNLIANRPYPMANDIAGVVVASADSKFAVGDEVFGTVWLQAQRKEQQGALAEYVRIAATSIAKRPKDIKPTEAAGISMVAVTASVGLFQHGNLQPGQNVFISGGSTAVGLAAIQFAKAIGCKVTVTGSGPKEEMLRTLGADEFMDYTKGPVYDRLIENPPSPKFDIIFDTVGSVDPKLFSLSEAYLAPDGTFLSVGPQPEGSGKLGQLANFFWTVSRPTWVCGGVNRKLCIFSTSESPEELARVVKFLEEKKFKPAVDSVYSFDQVVEAYNHLMTKRATGKVVIKVDPDVQ
ncbi:hypothetical protein QCA50_000022 [Cerrena zonata]|uniref:Enoyl reductase (ER) domain-containing protein n=1 Tax=Cerrena zonata TaxID=2478898 RepID=A0AAW0GZD2_9APHY